MAQPTVPLHSYEEYLERLEASQIRLEFVDGVVYAMAGGSPEHNRVVMRLTLAVGNQLKPPCEAYGPDQKIRTTNAGYFPDLSVICGDLQLAPDDKHAATNPAIVFEVMSPSTAATDQTSKPERYKTLASLKEYVLIWQPEPREQVHRRTDRGWSIEDYTNGDRVGLSCGVEVAVSELYAGM